MAVAPIDELGVSADAKEALAFAVLANETLMGHRGNLRSATGARRDAVLGKIATGWVDDGSAAGQERDTGDMDQ